VPIPNGLTSERNRLGISHILWGFDLSSFDRFKIFLDEAAGIGYEGIVCFDTTVMPWLDRAGEFKALLDQHDLALVGVILRPGLDYRGTDRLARFITAAGGEFMILSGPCGSEEDWSVVIPALERHAIIARRHGVQTVYHHHTNWIAETMEQTERLLADTDPEVMGAMLDCGHATKDFPEHTAADYFRRNHDRIRYVEFKDWRPDTDLRTEVGRGRCDWQAVAAVLREFNYRGWIVVEQNFTTRTPKEAASESFHFIRDYLGLGAEQ
jgi:sugar phosphate isomerase/epimerase